MSSLILADIGPVSPMLASEAEKRSKCTFISLRSLKELCFDETSFELLHSMVCASIRYGEIVCNYRILVKEGRYDERAEAEPSRTASHDALINSVNIFARYVTSANKGRTDWMKKVSLNRACYMVFGLEIAFEAIKEGGWKC